MGLPIAPKNAVCLTWRYTFAPDSDGTLVAEETLARIKTGVPEASV
ncbi:MULTISPECIES: hypothetical protein [unclassified Mycobacterium]|nr:MULTISPECIES: hypothetical protein [unclassified Mycobacterium]